MPSYDAVIVVSFGGPERPEDVLPFLESVVRGKNVPRDRLLEVARHYELFDGVSPSGAQIRALLAALVAELNAHGPHLPVYWANRHAHPLLIDTLRDMAGDGVQRALAMVTSAFGSYPGCRAYLEDIERARQEVGPTAPQIDKLRLFYNHPGFIEAMADRVAVALTEITARLRPAARLIFTAHSIPSRLAQTCDYERQFREACRLVWELVGQRVAGPDQKAESGERKAEGQPCGPVPRVPWELAFQSRSGPPSESWLKPDLADRLRELAASGDAGDVVIVPIGFVFENLEIVYDLDVEARAVCEEVGLNMIRAAVVGNHPRFVTMIRELIRERLDEHPTRLALGDHGPWPDACPADCCPPPLPT